MNAQSKTPRTDEIAQRHLAGCDIVTCYHYAIRLANDLETELAAVKAERDMWKANHDNQVKLKSAIMDRPDLGDRARKVTALSEQLAASHAREAQLREALRLMAEANPGVAVMPTIEAKKQNLAQRLALQALTLPPPPVVPQSVADDLRARLTAIFYLVEGDADGTVDATPYEKLCNEVAGLTGITL